MSIDVKKEMWELAHTLELKAFKANDIQAMNECVAQKGQLLLAIAKESGESAKEPQKAEFVPGNGVKDSLAGVGPLDGIGVRPDEQ